MSSHQPKIVKPPPELDGPDDFVPPSAEQLKQLTATGHQKMMSNQPSKAGDTNAGKPTVTEAAPTGSKQHQVASAPILPPKGNRKGAFLLVIFTIAGNLLALKMTALFGMPVVWAALVASGLVYLYFTQRWQDAENARWQANFDLLKSRTARVLNSPNESAEWLNAVVRSAWSAALPSLQPKVQHLLNSALAQSPARAGPISIIFRLIFNIF